MHGSEFGAKLNKNKFLQVYRLVEVTKNKIKNKINFLPTHWLKRQQIGNNHIFFCPKVNIYRVTRGVQPIFRACWKDEDLLSRMV